MKLKSETLRNDNVQDLTIPSLTPSTFYYLDTLFQNKRSIAYILLQYSASLLANRRMVHYQGDLQHALYRGSIFDFL